MKEQDVYSIGEASVVTGLSASALRYYDSIGLVVPAMRNPENNYRCYTKEQIILLCIVKRLRKAGCSIEVIRTVIADGDIEVLYSQLKRRMTEIEGEIEERQKLLDDNREFLNRLEMAVALRKDKRERNDSSDIQEYLFMNISIEEIPVMRVFSERRVLPDYNINHTSINAWSELYSHCEKAGFRNIGPAIATFHTNLLEQFIMKDCDLEFSVKIQDVDEKADAADQRVKYFGGFTAATAIYMGAYNKMIGTYLSLLQWINMHGYEATGVVSEEYIIAPAESYDQENQIIKIIIPVCKKNGKNVQAG